MASALHKEEGEVQISALIYSMGPEAEHVIQSLALPEGQAHDFDLIISKLDGYFIPRRNFVAERHNFELRSQTEGESNETYIRALFAQAERCNFSDRQERIRDRLVAGMRDQDLSRKIQLKALENDVTLDEVINMMRNVDLVNGRKEQNAEQPHESDAIDSVNKRHRNYILAHGTENRNKGRLSGFQSGTCRYCGRARHSTPQECPAKGRVCSNCQKRDHFAAVCRSKRVAAISDNRDEPSELDEPGFLLEAGQDDEWVVKLSMQDIGVKFKVDSGADVNVLTQHQYQKLPHPPTLHPATRKLISVGSVLQVLGQFEMDISYKGSMLPNEKFYVIKTNASLLSRSTSVKLGLLTFTDSLRQNGDNIGLMKTSPVVIRLKDGAKPSAVTSARNVPIPLKKAVEKELERLEEQGIIRHVTEPSDWCAPMVPVKKSDGSVRITVDYNNLNMAIKREVFPIPTLEQLTSEIHGATLFSKLDAASGFFQLPLDEESSKLTTFITPLGRKAFLRLPMGISLAPECFQRKMEELLHDLPGVVSYMDDIVCFGDEKSMMLD